jgi:hypothetical protein
MRKPDYAVIVRAIMPCSSAVAGGECAHDGDNGEVVGLVIAGASSDSVRCSGIIYLTVLEEMRDGAAW